jgi:hypothetical protein
MHATKKSKEMGPSLNKVALRKPIELSLKRFI